MPTQYVVKIDDDIKPDVLQYAEAQGVQPYEWIEQLIRKFCRPEEETTAIKPKH